MSDEMGRKELEQYDNEYGGTEPAEGGGAWDPVPDGDYEAEVEQASVVQSKSGKPMAKLKLRIVGEDSGGRVLWKNAVLTGNSLPYAKKDLAAVGIEVGKLSDLPDALAGLVGAVLEVAVRNKDDNQNVYFNDVLHAAPAQADPDDFPFG